MIMNARSCCYTPRQCGQFLFIKGTKLRFLIRNHFYNLFNLIAVTEIQCKDGYVLTRDRFIVSWDIGLLSSIIFSNFVKRMY